MRRFKVGDRVRVTTNTGRVYNHAMRVGVDGVIEHFLGHGSRIGERKMSLYQVGRLGGRIGYSLIFSGDQLELDILEELAKL
jgi:hypothetical protein